MTTSAATVAHAASETSACFSAEALGMSPARPIRRSGGMPAALSAAMSASTSSLEEVARGVAGARRARHEAQAGRAAVGELEVAARKAVDDPARLGDRAGPARRATAPPPRRLLRRARHPAHLPRGRRAGRSSRGGAVEPPADLGQVGLARVQPLVPDRGRTGPPWCRAPPCAPGRGRTAPHKRCRRRTRSGSSAARRCAPRRGPRGSPRTARWPSGRARPRGRAATRWPSRGRAGARRR